jgi:hypothetical protein
LLWISYIITIVCLSVRSTTVLRLNGSTKLARTVGFRDRKLARTVRFRNLWQLGSYKKKNPNRGVGRGGGQQGWGGRGGGSRGGGGRGGGWGKGEGGPRRVFFFFFFYRPKMPRTYYGFQDMVFETWDLNFGACEILGYGFQDMVFKTWDPNFGT